MQKKNKCSRRDVLQMLGATAGGAFWTRSAVNVLANSVLAGLANQAYAQATGVKPRRHLLIELTGAPPRWTSDLFLTPYSSTGFVSNPMVATRYTASGGVYTGTEYATTNINGLNVPWQWQFNVPRAGSGTRPMADLLKNILAIRGYTTNDDQHESAQAKIFMPLGASNSIPSLSAVNSGTPIPALDVDSTRYMFRSSAPITPVRLLTSGNMIATLMDPFTSKTGATFSTKRAALSTYISGALTQFRTYASTQHPQAAAIFDSQVGADQLLRGALGDLTTSWNTLYGKYNDIVKRAVDPFNDPIPGVTDLPIGTAARGDTYRVYGTSIITATDVRSIFASAYITKLAQHFAVAEYVLVNNISGSVTIEPQQFFGIPGNLDLTFDEHEMGSMISLIGNSLYNRALTGCLLELIDRLKAANMFNDTVIDVRGEFGRIARNDGTGSDHAGDASSVAFYSGIIQGPVLIGNTRNNQDGQGSWGAGSSITQLGMQMDGGHLASSLATMLGVPSPVTARPSVVSVTNGVLASLVEASKQV